MGKSIYSVLLNDELVEELDRVAYKNGVSRSVMLDKILADYLAMETPDIRMEGIFSRLSMMIASDSSLRFIDQPAATMASIKSALIYKYKPTVKYSVELFRNGENLGQVKVSLRTQSPVLISLMDDYNNFYRSLELHYLGEREYFYDDGRLVRVLKFPIGLGVDEIGEEIASFIRLFDSVMKDYFSGIDSLPQTQAVIERKYCRMIANCKV